MYKLHRRNPKEEEVDNKRLTEDIIHVFGQIAKKLILGESDPYSLKNEEIKWHSTMRRKTLRFFEEVGFHCWSLHKEFEEHSQEYATEGHGFPAEPFEITSYLTEVGILSRFHIEENTFEEIGYMEPDRLSDKHAIYVAWHLQDFDIKQIMEKIPRCYEKIKRTYIYPKAFLVQRNKAILKALIKKYSETDFQGFLEKRYKECYAGQVEEDNEVSFEYKLRNFARFPVTFGQPERAFLSPKGYVKEYQRVEEIVSSDHNRLKRLVKAVNKDGGCAKVVVEYIKECLLDITNKVAFLMNGDDGDRLAIQFILDNRDNFTYEYVYGGTQ
jgi:hypothetical protein